MGNGFAPKNGSRLSLTNCGFAVRRGVFSLGSAQRVCQMWRGRMVGGFFSRVGGEFIKAFFGFFPYGFCVFLKRPPPFPGGFWVGGRGRKKQLTKNRNEK